MPKNSYEPRPKSPAPRPKVKWSRKLPAKSERRYSENEQREAIRQAVFQRDGGCLLFNEGAGDCNGPDTPHHLLKASAGGPYTLENLVTLCAFHNTWVEDNPREARSRGLVRRPPIPAVRNPRAV